MVEQASSHGNKKWDLTSNDIVNRTPHFCKFHILTKDETINMTLCMFKSLEIEGCVGENTLLYGLEN